jgi:hypothetical protein
MLVAPPLVSSALSQASLTGVGAISGVTNSGEEGSCGLSLLGPSNQNGNDAAAIGHNAATANAAAAVFLRCFRVMGAPGIYFGQVALKRAYQNFPLYFSFTILTAGGNTSAAGAFSLNILSMACDMPAERISLNLPASLG